jgi:hypothetical protein
MGVAHGSGKLRKAAQVALHRVELRRFTEKSLLC